VCQIVAAFELARRFLLGGAPEDPGTPGRPPLRAVVHPAQAGTFRVHHSERGRRGHRDEGGVTVGLLDSAQIHPREVFANALADRAASVILVHNHPSGNLEPSPEDIAITRRLVQAGKCWASRSWTT